MSLASKKCVPCEGGVQPFSRNEINMYRKLVNRNWNVKAKSRLQRKFQFVNFKHTMQFVNQVASIAEEEGHHPVMKIGYGECTIDLWTHAISGLSENDFILAAKIDQL